jgi:hypothetical protein
MRRAWRSTRSRPGPAAVPPAPGRTAGCRNWASFAGTIEVASELFPLDRFGVLVPADRPSSGWTACPWPLGGRAAAAGRAGTVPPELPIWARVVPVDWVRASGLPPNGGEHSRVCRPGARGRLHSLHALVVCASTGGDPLGPLVDPPSHDPWSVVWRAHDHSELVRSVVRWKRALSRAYG